MPRKEIRYICPYCDGDYATRNEAQECFESHYEGEVYKLDLYYCVFCGFEFEEEQDCREHEAHCKERHEPVPENGVAATTANFALWRCAGRCPVPLTILPQAARPVPSGVK